MAANTEQPSRNASSIDTTRLDQFSDGERRQVCKTLHLPEVCGFARCRRTHRCHGEPRRCLHTHGAGVPQDVHTFAQVLLVAARYDRVRPGEGLPWLQEMYPRETEAFGVWSARFEARR